MARCKRLYGTKREQENRTSICAARVISEEIDATPNHILDHGIAIISLKCRPFKFQDKTVNQAIELMTNGCCGD